MRHTLPNPERIRRIALVTDFGTSLYIGQMHARLDAMVPGVPVIDLAHDLAPFRSDLAAYLLPALLRDMPEGTAYLAVVDPGVGGARDALLVLADGVCLVGPDNGLFAPLVRRAAEVSVWRVGWQPGQMSASFHGRDWFAPILGRLCQGLDLGLIPLAGTSIVGADWPRELAHILHVDHFGNLITGLDARAADAGRTLAAGHWRLGWARTFCEVSAGEPFWYANAFGLVEIAVNQGRADQLLGLGVGDPILGFMPRDAVTA